MKEVYWEDATSCDIVKHWHRQAMRARTSLGPVPIPARPQSAIDEAGWDPILEDRRVTERNLTHEVKISLRSVEKNPSMTIFTMSWERCQLYGFHGCLHLYRSKNGSSEVKYRDNQEEFLNVLLHRTKRGFETKSQSMQWKQYVMPPPKTKARVKTSAGKIM